MEFKSSPTRIEDVYDSIIVTIEPHDGNRIVGKVTHGEKLLIVVEGEAGKEKDIMKSVKEVFDFVEWKD